MKALPFVSVVVPTYNRAEPLSRCLQSLLKQTYPQERRSIVVVDDGGVVDLDSLVARLDGSDHITVLRQDNSGPAAVRNRGAREATGEFLAFTDDDCRPRPDWLANLVDTLVLDPDAMVGGAVVNGLTDSPLAQASQDLVSFLYDYFPDARALRPFLTTNNVAVHRKTFLEMGGFDESCGGTTLTGRRRVRPAVRSNYGSRLGDRIQPELVTDLGRHLGVADNHRR